MAPRIKKSNTRCRESGANSESGRVLKVLSALSDDWFSIEDEEVEKIRKANHVAEDSKNTKYVLGKPLTI